MELNKCGSESTASAWGIPEAFALSWKGFLILLLSSPVLLMGCSKQSKAETPPDMEYTVATSQLTDILFNWSPDGQAFERNKALITKLASGQREFVDGFRKQLITGHLSQGSWRWSYLPQRYSGAWDIFCVWGNNSGGMPRRAFLAAVSWTVRIAKTSRGDVEVGIPRFEAMASIEWPGDIDALDLEGVYVVGESEEGLEIRVQSGFGHPRDDPPPVFRVTFDHNQFKWDGLVGRAKGEDESGPFKVTYWSFSRPKENVPALMKALGDPDAPVRSSAAYELGEMGPTAKNAIPELERLAAKDPDQWVRRAARDALEKIRK